jgi:hypothetical protein
LDGYEALAKEASGAAVADKVEDELLACALAGFGQEEQNSAKGQEDAPFVPPVLGKGIFIKAHGEVERRWKELYDVCLAYEDAPLVRIMRLMGDRLSDLKKARNMCFPDPGSCPLELECWESRAAEEPEACEEFFAWANDYFEPIAKKTIEYFKPDIACIGDDSASKYAPFVSPDTYRRLLKPSYHNAAKYAVERGIPVQFHNCGKAEAYLPDMIDFGVRYWDPAQTENDLVAAKENYKDLVVVGGFDIVPPADHEFTEEEVRQSVRDTIDKYAVGGRYSWMGMYLGPFGDKTAEIINSWIRSEVETYGMNYYDKH